MKVYLVRAFTAEEWENYSWVHGVYATKEKAQAIIDGFGRGVQEENLDDGQCGWFIDVGIAEIEVQ